MLIRTATKDALKQIVYVESECFGLAYENVQRLEKTVANNRKSVENMKQ